MLALRVLVVVIRSSLVMCVAGMRIRVATCHRFITGYLVTTYQIPQSPIIHSKSADIAIICTFSLRVLTSKCILSVSLYMMQQWSWNR